MVMVPKPVAEQIIEIYKRMAREAKYRPSAPADMLGQIDPDYEGKIGEEAEEYVTKWWLQEDDGLYDLGCCDFETRPAAVFATEAAHLLNNGMFNRANALALLHIAVDELQEMED